MRRTDTCGDLRSSDVGRRVLLQGWVHRRRDHGGTVFIDRTTLAVTPQGEVRYVIVARSSEGVDNVRFEALRCGSAEFRTYSFGQNIEFLRRTFAHRYFNAVAMHPKP